MHKIIFNCFGYQYLYQGNIGLKLDLKINHWSSLGYNLKMKFSKMN